VQVEVVGNRLLSIARNITAGLELRSGNRALRYWQDWKRGMFSFAKGATGFLGMGLLMFTGACAPSYDYRPLSLAPAVDCAAEPGQSDDFDYWVLGETGDRMIWRDCDKAGSDLAGRNLATADLKGADLRGADLKGADLGAVNASGADFSAADLRGADVTAIFWRGAVLRQANLTGLDLTGVEMDAVDLSGALWTDGVTRCAPEAIGQCQP